MINTLTDTLKNILRFTKQKEVKCTIDNLEAPLFECGPGHLTQGYGFFGYTGVPAPTVLTNDPWFGPAPISDSNKDYMEREYDVLKEDVYTIQETKEQENIHQIMYEIATRCGKTTTQLDPVGGSENFQGGSEKIHG
tara:strand:+ start:668 stop:1078 length:411 start_codon:yes stop_codon:yes gene_type:complete